MTTLNIGLVGYGYWGPKLARNFANNESCCIRRIAESNETRRTLAGKKFPNAEICSEENSVLSADDIDVAIIATPAATHFDFACRALEHGKHLWIEKPMTVSNEQSDALINLAEQKDKIVMVDHTFLFTSAIQTIKAVIDKNELGRIFFYDSIRINLGIFQSDINVIWDLAPHDLSIMDFILGPGAKAISANARGHLGAREDVGYLTIYYDDNLIAHVHVNWLSPVKIRLTTIGGSKKALVWNDMERDTPIKIYEHGAVEHDTEDAYKLLTMYRKGMMYAPVVPITEALEKEVAYFVDCVFSNRQPFNNAVAGARVVKMLSASSLSLEQNGAAVEL